MLMQKTKGTSKLVRIKLLAVTEESLPFCPAPQSSFLTIFGTYNMSVSPEQLYCWDRMEKHDTIFSSHKDKQDAKLRLILTRII